VQLLQARELGSRGRDAAAMERLAAVLREHGGATVSPATVDAATGAVTSPLRGARADAVTAELHAHAHEATTAETPVTGAGPRHGLPAALLGLHGTYEERQVERGAANRLGSVALGEQPLVSFVGKLIPQKGPQLLLAALPLVAAQHPGVRLAIVGFGPMREPLAALTIALARGDEATIDELVAHGACFDGASAAGPLPFLPEFFAGLRARGELEQYLADARDLHERVLFTGPVDHEVLSALWPLCRASVVPSVLPEAFGMVAAEAAACGCPPVVADHSGLHDVAEVLRAAAPGWARDALAFDLARSEPVAQLAASLTTLLDAAEPERVALAGALRDAVVRTWGWDAVAGHLAGLLGAPTATT
jgi:glycosyltransferase involved in cell wall biosynthesis